MNPGWRCPRRIGFLFPHACERATPMGCPDCQNGQVIDPYRTRADREGYSDYDAYDPAVLASYGATNYSDFTEADGEKLIKPREEFEDDFSAS